MTPHPVRVFCTRSWPPSSHIMRKSNFWPKSGKQKKSASSYGVFLTMLSHVCSTVVLVPAPMHLLHTKEINKNEFTVEQPHSSGVISSVPSRPDYPGGRRPTIRRCGEGVKSPTNPGGQRQMLRGGRSPLSPRKYMGVQGWVGRGRPPVLKSPY